MQGGKEQQVRWDDINAVWQQITNHTKYGHTMYTTHIYTLETKDKRVLEFGADLKGTAKLGKTLVEEVNKRLYPQMVADYNAGQTVAFEPFTLSKEGVGHKNKYLSWAEIEGAQIDKGYVTFKKQGKWFNWVNVPAAQIPNVLIFLALVDYAIGLKRGAEYSH